MDYIIHMWTSLYRNVLHCAMVWLCGSLVLWSCSQEVPDDSEQPTNGGGAARIARQGGGHQLTQVPADVAMATRTGRVPLRT